MYRVAIKSPRSILSGWVHGKRGLHIAGGIDRYSG